MNKKDSLHLISFIEIACSRPFIEAEQHGGLVPTWMRDRLGNAKLTFIEERKLRTN